jgi:malonyl-CoA O-methyltransferase
MEFTSFIHKEIAFRLAQRLQFFKIKPASILIIESEPNYLTQQCQQLFSSNISTTNNLAEFANSNFKFELILTNLWLNFNDLTSSLIKIHKLLTSEGVILFSLFGIDTLKDYQEIYNPQFKLLDMHNLGDFMLKQGFIDPVLDVEYMKAKFKNTSELQQEFVNLGIFSNEDYRIELPDNSLLSPELEIIFAHAWGKQQAQQFKDASGKTFIPLDLLQ